VAANPGKRHTVYLQMCPAGVQRKQVRGHGGGAPTIPGVIPHFFAHFASYLNNAQHPKKARSIFSFFLIANAFIDRRPCHFRTRSTKSDFFSSLRVRLASPLTQPGGAIFASIPPSQLRSSLTVASDECGIRSKCSLTLGPLRTSSPLLYGVRPTHRSQVQAALFALLCGPLPPPSPLSASEKRCDVGGSRGSQHSPRRVQRRSLEEHQDNGVIQ